MLLEEKLRGRKVCPWSFLLHLLFLNSFLEIELTFPTIHTGASSSCRHVRTAHSHHWEVSIILKQSSTSFPPLPHVSGAPTDLFLCLGFPFLGFPVKGPYSS